MESVDRLCREAAWHIDNESVLNRLKLNISCETKNVFHRKAEALTIFLNVAARFLLLWVIYKMWDVRVV